MPEAIDEILYDLQCRNNTLYYSDAVGFCYINQKYFSPNTRPTYKQYFLPFKDYKSKTFYEICEINYVIAENPYLKDYYISDCTENIFLIIRKIYVVGITSEEAAQLSENVNIQRLNIYSSSTSSIYTIDGSPHLQIYELSEESDIVKYYNIDTNPPNDKVFKITL